MNVSSSALTAATGANTNDQTNPPLALITLAETALTTTNPDTTTDMADSSTLPTSTNSNTTTDDPTLCTSSTINAATIRKADDISPSPICVATLPPSRSQDPPKQARTSTTRQATKFFLRDLTSIDPPEVTALYPIFKFGKNNVAVSSTDTNNKNNKTQEAATGRSAAPPSPTPHVTHQEGENNEDDLKPPANAPTVTNPSELDASPSKQLVFSPPDSEDSTPLSSVKLAPIKNSNTPNSTPSGGLKSKSILRSKVAISPKQPEVRVYEKDSPANPKEPEPVEIVPAEPHNHKYKTVFEMSIKIPRCDKVLPELTNKMIGALSFIRQWADPTAAYLPKNDPTKTQITNKASFPTVIFPLDTDYFVFATATWHYAPKAIQGKVVRLSVVIGSDVSPDTIALCRPDLNTMGIGFDIKAHQNIDTNTRIVLLGAPNTISKSEAKKICYDVYQSALQKYKVEHAEEQLSLTVDIPDFAVILNYPQGLPITRTEGEEDKYIPPPKERRALHIMCSTSDFEGFAKLTEYAKEQDLWRPVFGMCYPTITPQVDADEAKLERYIQMISIHESVQRCYANTVISGLLNVDKAFTLRKDDGSSATFTARQLISHIKIYDPIPKKHVPVFLCLLRRDDLRYHAYFPGGNDVIKRYVDAFRQCPGPQLYFYLLKRRFLLGDVSKFIRSVFNLEQQALCSRAKYNKVSKMAVVPPIHGQMDIIDAVAAPGSGFLTAESVRRSPALQPIKYSGPSNKAIEYYDFADGQSLTTIKTAGAKKATSTDSIVVSTGIGNSVYVPEGSAAISKFDDDESMEDAEDGDNIGDDEEGTEFVFDLEALKEIEKAALNKSITPQNAQPTMTPPPAPLNPTTMSEANSKAIQEQLTLTLVACNKASDALQLGDDDSMDTSIPDVPNFAVALEDITNKNYATMLEIIDSISNAIPITEDDEPSIEIPDDIQHPLFTQSLRDVLASDLLGAEESLADYIECMRMAIQNSLKVTEGYMTDSNDATSQHDNEVLVLSASTSTDAAAKLQGCVQDTDTETTTEKSAVGSSIVPANTSRLGADLE